MSDFLQTMATASAERAAAVSPKFSSADFDKPLLPVSTAGFGIIAEIKERSPAEGDLRLPDNDRLTQARRYIDGGAAAISVLTEPTRFDGDITHLEAVAAAAPETPVMRKDFLVDPVQVSEARKAGASGVLLIAAMLPDQRLRELLDRAWEHGLFVLLETFDADDLTRSSRLLDNSDDAARCESGQLLIGVNTRNLRTLEVDAKRLERLAPALPDAICVAESGLHGPEDAERVAGWGYQMALVGTALMKSADPTGLLAAMHVAGTRAMAA
jgi:indole-3-glycerol phosphate synthase